MSGRIWVVETRTKSNPVWVHRNYSPTRKEAREDAREARQWEWVTKTRVVQYVRQGGAR